MKIGALAGFLIFGLCDVAFADTILTLTVPGTALNTTGYFAEAPDEGGGFDIGVRLKDAHIEASGCVNGSDYLDVSMGDTAFLGSASTFTPEQKKLIARKVKYFYDLTAAAKTTSLVRLHIDTSKKYLFSKDGVLVAPYCTITFDSETFDDD